VKRVIPLALFIMISNVSLYSMKRPRPDDQKALVIEYGPSHKKVDVDSNQLFSDEWKRRMIFFGFQVQMNLEYIMPPEQLAQLRETYGKHGKINHPEYGPLLEQFYLASMNNIYAPRELQKIGGPSVSFVDDKIVFE